jgi:hypothetical protein
MKFEWDSQKADENIDKHRVSFDIAKTVFKDKFAKYLYDEEHSDYEERFVIIGTAEIINQELYVCYCMRGENKEITRLISARRATKQETKLYMESRL